MDQKTPVFGYTKKNHEKLACGVWGSTPTVSLTLKYPFFYDSPNQINKIMFRTPCRMQCGRDFLDEPLLRKHEGICYSIMLARGIVEK